MSYASAKNCLSLIYSYLDEKYKDPSYASRRKGKKTKNLVPKTGIDSATEDDQVELAEQEAITCGRRNHMGMTNIFSA